MPKTEISVTVDEELLKTIERLAPGATLSEIVEAALERWARDPQRHSLETDIEQYYIELTSLDNAEDEDSADLGGRSLRETWK